jgi:hypothetical protein
MMEKTSAAQLKGRARGAAICGIFGAVWMFDTVYFGAIANQAWLNAIAFLAGVFVAWPLSRLRSLRYLEYSPADRQRWATISRAYWANAAVEWLACIAAGIWLAHIRRYDLILPSTGVIIAAHFLPLAKIFRMPLYYWTGAAMALGILASLAVPAGHVRSIATCTVMGLSLWATTALILCQDKLSSR